MPLFKLIAPSAHISGVDKIFGQDWNDLINTLTGGLANLITLTGGLTMSGSDITLAGNKIKTTIYNINEASLEFLGTGLLIQASTANTKGLMGLAGSGTAVNNVFDIFRTSDVFTNVEGLRLGTDLGSVGEVAIQSFVKGTGIQRPINVYIQGTKLMSFDAANTITAYVPIITQAAQELIGVGSAALGANSPAVTLTAPYKWIKFQTSDGSTVYVPAWK